VRLGLFAKNSNTDIHLSNLDESVLDIKPSYLFLIAFVELCLLTITLIYLWPMNIAPQKDRKLPWYYPFTCSYWCSKESGDEDDLAEPLMAADTSSLQPEELELIQKGLMEPIDNNLSQDTLQI